MYSTRSSVGRGYINTPGGAKEVVIISSPQVVGGGSQSTSKGATATPTPQQKTNATLQQMAQCDNEAATPPSVRYALSSGVKVLALTPNAAKNSPVLSKRSINYDFNSSSKSKLMRSSDKSKGLRHFSTKVCDKVREKGVTNYNEVADELVQEYFESLHNPPSSQEKQIYDQKNIRRRVYDALNVLMAMNIITKEKKEIRWVGLPTSSVQESNKLEEEKARRMERIAQKTEQLKDLVLQLIAFKSLVERNKGLEETDGKPKADGVLSLPYILVCTDKSTEVDCSISQDKTEYLFKFNKPFELLEDMEILKRLGYSHGLDLPATAAELSPEKVQKLKSYLPVALREYIDHIVDGSLTLKFSPTVQSLPTKNLIAPRFYDRYEDKSRSLDAADMEVAMTLSAAAAAGTSSSSSIGGAGGPTSLRCASDSQQHDLHVQHHSYYQAAHILASDQSGGSGSRDRRQYGDMPMADDLDEEEQEEEEEDDEMSHSDFSDFESIGSNSNQEF